MIKVERNGDNELKEYYFRFQTMKLSYRYASVSSRLLKGKLINGILLNKAITLNVPDYPKGHTFQLRKVSVKIILQKLSKPDLSGIVCIEKII